MDFTAWSEIRRKKVTQETLDSAKKTEEVAPESKSYVVALLELQLKKTEDAQQTLKQALRNNGAILDAQAWVIYGDICDQYGFSEAANAAWARARSAKAETRAARWALETLDNAAH